MLLNTNRFRESMCMDLANNLWTQAKILKSLLLVASLLVGLNGFGQSAKVEDGRYDISVTKELYKFCNPAKLPCYEDKVQSYQVSTADTTGGNEDGFSGKYSFLRKNPDNSLVIFDAKGPGTINRFWTPTPTADTLDFYIDNENEISFSIKYSDLFSTKVFPFVAPLCGNELGGFYCYFPIPFKRCCKIVCRGEKLQFHQIQYKLFEKSVKVKSFSPVLSEEEQYALVQLKESWGNNERNLSNFKRLDVASFKRQEKQLVLNPGRSETIFETAKGGRIMGIEFSPSGIFTGLQKQIDIRITWDNEKIPAVYCPVADFFGYGFGKPSMQSILIGSQSGKNYCYFPMPFDTNAKVELIYRENPVVPNLMPVQLNMKVYYSSAPRNQEIEGKFYAHWNQEVPEIGRSYEFLNRNGKGHYVGTVLQAQGLKPGMTLFFEGDDSTQIDGETRILGTGSEDYFNGGWYAFMDRWDRSLSLPLHGSLGYSLPFCRTGGYRFYMTDKIPFRNRIVQQMEHGPEGNRFPLWNTSVAYYYCDSPILQKGLIPNNESAVVYQPDTLIVYPQLMEYVVWDKISMEPVWVYDTGGYSFIYTVNNDSRLRVSLGDIPNGNYAIYLDLTKYGEGCSFSIWQRQTQISEWIDTYHSEKQRIKSLYSCNINIDEFKNSLTFRFKTSNILNKLFLSRLILIKKNL